MMVGSPVRLAMLRRAAYIAGLLAVTVVAVISVTGCGGSSDAASGATLDEVLAQVEGLSGAERTKKLVELAEAEGGELSFYTTSSIDVSAELAEAFEDAYDLDVSVFKGGEHPSATDGRGEARPASMVPTWSRQRDQPELSELTEDDARPVSGAVRVRARGGLAHTRTGPPTGSTCSRSPGTRSSSRGPGAKSWEDLADPRWKGKLSAPGGRLRMVQDALGALGRVGQDAGGGRPAHRGHRPQRDLHRWPLAWARASRRGRVRRHRQPPPHGPGA